MEKIDKIDEVVGILAPDPNADVSIPSVTEIAARTLDLIKRGVFDTVTMRLHLAEEFGLTPNGFGWSTFVNNHAWALVRLQRSYAIRKVGRQNYVIEHKTTSQIGDTIDKVEIAGVLAGWAETLRSRANGVNRTNGSADVVTGPDMIVLWRRCRGICTLTSIGFSETIVGTGQAEAGLCALAGPD